jgi:hypothetical protein
MRDYCTLFDRNYLSRGLALHSSLARQGKDVRLFVLCLDEPTLHALAALALPQVELIAAAALESWDPELHACRFDRNAAEFYFTCKPVLLRYVLERYGVERATYLDSDLYFFSDAEPVEREFEGGDVILTPHRFPPRLAYMKRSGGFNAGWVGVRGTAEGRRFLEWWRARCIEWCRIVFEETRFGDQKYLDQVPLLFRNVVQVAHPGVNAAPWNIDGLRVTSLGQDVFVDEHPLIAFHFHGIKRVIPRLYDSGLLTYRTRLTRVARNAIFRPYLQELARGEARLAALPEPLRTAVMPAPVAPGRRGWAARLRVMARILVSRTAIVGP